MKSWEVQCLTRDGKRYTVEIGAPTADDAMLVARENHAPVRVLGEVPPKVEPEPRQPAIPKEYAKGESLANAGLILGVLGLFLVPFAAVGLVASAAAREVSGGKRGAEGFGLCFFGLAVWTAIVCLYVGIRVAA